MNRTFSSDREAGIQLAIDFADRIEPDWSEGAYAFLVDFARRHDVFSGEDVSNAHIESNQVQPPDLRAWGALYRRATREGVISHLDNDGWSKRRSSPCPRYVSIIYRSKAA